MINEDQAREMMKKLSKLKKKINKSLSDKQKYYDYEAECLKELKPFVDVRAGKYKRFSNYNDLSQEAMEALLKAIRTFKLKDLNGNNKGSFFFWAGLFVNTKLSRSANNHTVIRYPMHFAAKNKPHKENNIPIILDKSKSPEKHYEQSELNGLIQNVLKELSKDQREVVNLAYGFNGDRPLSITKICAEKKISRANCLRVLNSALDILRSKIDF